MPRKLTPTGTECVRHGPALSNPCGSKQNREWYVKQDGWRYKRKAVLIMETVLQRKLTPSECQRIVFIDGNRLNCIQSNLLLPASYPNVSSCKSCGSLLVRKNRKCKNKGKGTGYCKNCLDTKLECRILIGNVPKLSPQDVVNMRRMFAIGLGKDFVARLFHVAGRTALGIRRGEHWKRLPPMPADTRKNWEVLVEQARKLASEGRGSIFDRITLLSKAEADKECRADLASKGTTPEEIFRPIVSDTCANYTELREMLKMFPKRKQWNDGDLGLMRSQMVNKLCSSQKAKKGSKPPASRKRASLAEFEKLQNENALLRQRVELLEQELTMAKEAIAALKAGRPEKRRGKLSRI